VSRYRDQVVAALQAVTIRLPTRYTWLGRASRRLPGSLSEQMDEAGRRDYLIACLRAELYSSFYCHGRPVPARWGAVEPVSADPWLTNAMSQANTGRGSWEPGWTIQRLEGKDALVATSRLRARIRAADCRTIDGPLRVGASVSLRLPKELPARSPGFFTIVSEAVADAASAGAVVRVYWNIGRAGAPDLVGALTSRLNTDNVPFRLKVGDHPFRLDRCDAAVLYLPAGAFPAVRETLRHVAAMLTPRLRPDVPAFTLQLAPGVGLAEDGRAGESFGAHRCGLLADGIVRGHERGTANLGARLEAVAARFADEGVSIDAPYLEPSLVGRHVL
jgi:hypothetical protein